VTPATRWLDVGCGRHLFPSNPKLSRRLADRCARLVGIDPDGTLAENPYSHDGVQDSIFNYRSSADFDLVTLRMVVEYIGEPERPMEILRRVTVPGGRVIIYTVFRWSPIPLLTRLIPFRLHHSLKRVLWNTEERDTFPVRNRMNTRRALRDLFESAGFTERYFAYLDDCTLASRWPPLFFVELSLWRLLHMCGLLHPEVCLLGEYKHLQQAGR